MKKYIFTVFAVAAVLSSCSKSLELNGDINSGAKAITTIGASTEISTRAVVSSSDNTKVNWETGDQLGVLGANGSSEARNLAYELTAGTGSTIGTFQNNSSDITTISAIMYPYQENAIWDGTNSKLTCEIPSVQTAVKGSFDKNAAVMYSIGNTTDANLNFAVNFLKVTVTETNVHAISISSSDALSGKMEITSSGVSGAPSGSLNSVSITAARGEVLQTGDYYIAVKKGDIADPTISYVYLDQTNHTATEKTKAGSATLSFASGTNVKPVLVDFNSGSVITRDAVQLWAEGPYFADRNVGASSATEIGNTMTFTDATAENFTWGPNWCTPSKAQMDELLKAATDDGSEKVTCVYTNENGKSGFKFTGIETGYTSNSVFFPAQDVRFGTAGYWSATANDSEAWCMGLSYRNGNWFSGWRSDTLDYGHLVRPVLKN